MTEITRQNFQNHREGLLRNFESTLGVSFSELSSDRKIFTEGMKSGSVTIYPQSGEKGIFGILHLLTEVGGKKVEQIVEVKDRDKAAFLIGLQHEVKSPRRR